MNHDEFEMKCWNYYLSLEKNFISSLYYVSLDTENFNAFSNSFLDQIISICIEIESSLKIITGYQSNNTNIRKLTRILLDVLPDVANITVHIYGLDNYIIKPYNNLDMSEGRVLFGWWRAYTQLKHNRFANQKEGNLKNVLDSLAALFVIDTCYLKQTGESAVRDSPKFDSSLFITHDITWRCSGMNEVFFQIETTNV